MPNSEGSMFVRIEKLETFFDEYRKTTNRRLENLEDSKSTLERIVTVTEMNIEQIIKREEKQDIREEKQELTLIKLSDTLNKINANLDSFNEGQHSLAVGQEDLEKRMDKYEERGKIDIWATVTRITWLVITTLVTAFVTYWLTQNGFK